MDFVLVISCRMSGTRDEASNTNFVLSSSNFLIKKQREPILDSANPIPMAALLGFLGIKDNNFLDEPIVNLSSGNGMNIKSGENILEETKLIFGIAVYTKSVPLTNAAIDDKSGAPWYILLPPTISTMPFSPFLDRMFRGLIIFLM